jgi:hypothetical protein
VRMARGEGPPCGERLLDGRKHISATNRT